MIVLSWIETGFSFFFLFVESSRSINGYILPQVCILEQSRLILPVEDNSTQDVYTIHYNGYVEYRGYPQTLPLVV